MKSSESRQLAFAFADNSQESRHTPKADVSAGKAYLLYQANANLTTETDARIDSGGEVSAENLLEEVASLPNLAVALLQVARNKGAPGVDGLSVQEVVEHAQQLLPKIKRCHPRMAHVLDGCSRAGSAESYAARGVLRSNA